MLTVMPAGADEVSLVTAAQLTAHAQALSAQAAAMNQMLAELIASIG